MNHHSPKAEQHNFPLFAISRQLFVVVLQLVQKHWINTEILNYRQQVIPGKNLKEIDN